MTVTINGTPHELDDGATLLDALAAVGIAADARGVAVARGDEVVRRADWPSTALTDGDRLEVVTAVQGG